MNEAAYTLLSTFGDKVNLTRLGLQALIVLALVVGWSGAAQAISIQLGASGCAQAHCTPNMSDQALTAPPLSQIEEKFAKNDVEPGTNQGEGSRIGLGCSSNLTVVACSYAGLGHVRVFNGKGEQLSEESPVSGTFDGSASRSAPVVFTDGGVLAADKNALYYRPPSTSVTPFFTYPKKDLTGTPDTGQPIGPIVLPNGIIFISEVCGDATVCGVATYRLNKNATGTSGDPYITGPIAHAALSLNGVAYEANNTPSSDLTQTGVVANSGVARVYLTATTTCGNNCDETSPRQGQLFAIDIQTTEGSDLGKFTSLPRSIFDFPAPAGASPLVVRNLTKTILGISRTGTGIFFDGQKKTPLPIATTCNNRTLDTSSTSSAGCFFGILDTSPKTINPTQTIPAQTYILFANSYPNAAFQASAALDPRSDSGLWVFPVTPFSATTTCSLMQDPSAVDNCLIRLNLLTGELMQLPIDVGRVLGTVTGGQNDKSYIPASVMTLSVSGSNVYMTIGAVHTLLPFQNDPLVTVFRLPSASESYSYTSQSSLFQWRTLHGNFGGQYLPTPAYGQFPIVQYTEDNVTHRRIVFNMVFQGPYFYGN